MGGIENEGKPMPRTRKSHPPSLKAKVAIEEIKEHKTTAQIAQMVSARPRQGGRNRRWLSAGCAVGNGREQMRQ
jgi:hypothetical protein